MCAIWEEWNDLREMRDLRSPRRKEVFIEQFRAVVESGYIGIVFSGNYMKGYLICLVFVAAIFVHTTDSIAQTSKQKTPSFDPSGDYHPLSLPSLESEKFIQFDLNVTRKRNRLFASGAVKGAQPWYKFTSTDISDKHLRFTTASVKGVSYRFDGKFLGRGDFASQWSGAGLEMLKGTLRKILNGKVILETKSTFVYYPGC